MDTTNPSSDTVAADKPNNNMSENKTETHNDDNIHIPRVIPLSNFEKQKNRLMEIPAHLRHQFHSKSHFYMTTLMCKFKIDLEMFEQEHPELCNKQYKQLVQDAAYIEALREGNNTLYKLNGCDFDITDYCERIDDYLIRNNKDCELYLLKVGPGHPSAKKPDTEN